MRAAARRLSRAIQQVQQGDLPGALSTAQKVVRYNPEYAEGRFILGMLCRDSGRLDEALEHLEHAVRSRPRDAAIVDALGTVHHASGRFREARQAFLTAVKLDPSAPAALYNLGSASLEVGDDQAARDCFQRLCELQPRDPEVWLNLGVSQARQGHLQQATAALRRATALDPSSASACMNLAGVLAHLGHLEEPGECYRRACELEPGSPRPHQRLGWYLAGRGQHGAAREAFEQALVLDPSSGPAAAGLAHLAEAAGQVQEARALLAPHLVASGGDVRVASTWAAICLRLGCPQDAICVVQPLAERALPALEEARLRFALGNLEHASGQPERAFQNWLRANERLGLGWDLVAARARTDRIQRAWADPSTLARASHGDLRPIFVLGLPRSGTSLTEQILGCHSGVRPAGEREELRQLALRQGRGWADTAAAMDAPALDAVAREYLWAVAGPEGGERRVTDKMPVNFRYIGWIRQLFPQAHIVHLQRHPLDVALSCLRQHFVGRANGWSTSLDGIASLIAEHDALMAHWRAQGTEDLHVVRYEDLVTRPEATVRQLLDRVGLPFEDACLRPHESARQVHTASYAQVQEPIHSGAVDKWHRYATQLRPLAHALGLEDQVDAVLERGKQGSGTSG